MPAWVEIASGDVDAGSRADTTLFAAYKQRDEAGADKPFQVDFAETSQTGNTHPTFGAVIITRKLWVPSDAKTLRITLEMKVSAGTGYLRGILSATNCDADQSTASTSYVEKTLTWTDISALRGTAVDLTFKVSADTSGRTTYAKSVDRITARWGYD